MCIRDRYDAHSNITDVTKDGVLHYQYGYDMMNQLVSVDDKLNGKVYNYTYDAGCNLISETVTDSNGTTSNAYEYNNLNMIQTEFCIMSDILLSLIHIFNSIIVT